MSPSLRETESSQREAGIVSGEVKQVKANATIVELGQIWMDP